MPEMKTLTINGVTYEVVDQTARDDVKKIAARNNLLDNSYFMPNYLINQREISSYELSSFGGYCVDRWAAHNGGATVTVGNDGLTVSGAIYQPIASDTIARYNGKVLTLAAKIDGAVYFCSGVVHQKGEWYRCAFVDTASGAISFETEEDNKMFVVITNNSAAAIEWVALYEGEYTAKTLPDYHPKGYITELMECQRYFRNIYGDFIGTCDDDTVLDFGHTFKIPIRTPMISNALIDPDSIIVNNSGTVFTLDGTPLTTSFNGVRTYDDYITVFLRGDELNSNIPVMVINLNFSISLDL